MAGWRENSRKKSKLKMGSDAESTTAEEGKVTWYVWEADEDDPGMMTYMGTENGDPLFADDKSIFYLTEEQHLSVLGDDMTEFERNI